MCGVSALRNILKLWGTELNIFERCHCALSITLSHTCTPRPSYCLPCHCSLVSSVMCLYMCVWITVFLCCLCPALRIHNHTVLPSSHNSSYVYTNDSAYTNISATVGEDQSLSAHWNSFVHHWLLSIVLSECTHVCAGHFTLFTLFSLLSVQHKTRNYWPFNNRFFLFISFSQTRIVKYWSI